jgi:hypothetical protein
MILFYYVFLEKVEKTAIYGHYTNKKHTTCREIRGKGRGIHKKKVY